VPLQIFKSLDSSFRWNDVVLAFPQERRKFPRTAVSESWNPVPLQIFKSLDSSFRWNDELMALNSHGKFSMRGVMPAHF
jgi:hypothetical protein